MNTTVSTDQPASTEPTFIIRVGNVYYVTAAVLTYDPDSPNATEENKRFIAEQLAPFYQELVGEEAPPSESTMTGTRSLTADIGTVAAGGGSARVKQIVGLPAGFRDQQTDQQTN